MKFESIKFFLFFFAVSHRCSLHFHFHNESSLSPSTMLCSRAWCEISLKSQSNIHLSHCHDRTLCRRPPAKKSCDVSTWCEWKMNVNFPSSLCSLFHKDFIKTATPKTWSLSDFLLIVSRENGKRKKKSWKLLAVYEPPAAASLVFRVHNLALKTLSSYHNRRMHELQWK